MSVVQAISAEDEASNDRWHQWQLRYATSSRRDANRMRIAFTLLLAGLGAWLGLQLLAPSL
jgi:hypothetical protein